MDCVGGAGWMICLMLTNMSHVTNLRKYHNICDTFRREERPANNKETITADVCMQVVGLVRDDIDVRNHIHIIIIAGK